MFAAFGENLLRNKKYKKMWYIKFSWTVLVFAVLFTVVTGKEMKLYMWKKVNFYHDFLRV